jgi:3-methyladenine DNA glycosylase AlkD
MNLDATVTEIRAEIAALAKRDTPSLRAVRKGWSARLKEQPAAEVIAAAQALERMAGQGGKWIGYELIRFHPGAFATVTEAEVADFATRIESWYATDAFGTILSGPLWAKGRISDHLIDDWSRSDDRWLRRSALVATVGRNATRPDPASTFDICLRLATDADDMVEKAVSWTLRYLSQKDRDAVVAFMAKHGDKFRPRVRREVRNKLTTGLKTPKGPRLTPPITPAEQR